MVESAPPEPESARPNATGGLVAVAPGIAVGGTSAQAAASALGPFVLDGVNVGRVLIAVAVLVTSLYALQLLAQGGERLTRHLRGADAPPPPRVLLFPRLQNMLLKVSVPLLTQAGTLGVSAGDEPWHTVVGSVMLAVALMLLGGACASVRRACHAGLEEAQLVVAVEPADRSRLAWLLGRPGGDAVWVGSLVDGHGNLFENYWCTRAAMVTTPVLLIGSLAQSVLAGAAHLVSRGGVTLLCVLGVQLMAVLHICVTVPFIDSFRHKCSSVSSVCQVTASLLALCAPTDEDVRTAVVVLKVTALVVSSSASALSVAYRVASFDRLRERVAGVVAARERPQEKERAASISIVNPLANDGGADVSRTAEGGAPTLNTLADVLLDGAAERVSSDSVVLEADTLMKLFDEDSAEAANTDDSGDMSAPWEWRSSQLTEGKHQVSVKEALFGGGAYSTRHDTIGDTYNPLFALGSADEALGGMFDVPHASPGGCEGATHVNADNKGEHGSNIEVLPGDERGRQRALGLGLMRSVVASCASALPDAEEVEAAARDRASTTSTAFSRRMREIAEGMETVVALATTSEASLDTECLEAQAAVGQLMEVPSADTAVNASGALAILLDACNAVCERLGVRIAPAARLGERSKDGQVALSPLDVLRSMLAAAATQLNTVRLVDRAEREALFQSRAIEEREVEEARLREHRQVLRAVSRVLV